MVKALATSSKISITLSKKKGIKEVAKPVKKHTTDGQRIAMLDWLSLEENFKLITGNAGMNAAVVAEKKLKKINAYRGLADYVNLRTDSNWTEKMAQTRYDTLLKKYKLAHRSSLLTGFGCSSEDLKAVPPIDTIPKKLESMCPFYDRLDALFGERENITPSSVFESSVSTK
jgi:hypothetical protein